MNLFQIKKDLTSLKIRYVLQHILEGYFFTTV